MCLHAAKVGGVKVLPVIEKRMGLTTVNAEI